MHIIRYGHKTESVDEWSTIHKDASYFNGKHLHVCFAQSAQRYCMCFFSHLFPTTGEWIVMIFGTGYQKEMESLSGEKLWFNTTPTTHEIQILHLICFFPENYI